VANGGIPCLGLSNQTRVCNYQPCPIDCQWSSWVEWSPCSPSCGAGIKARYRLIKVTPQYGGTNCTGSANDTSYCCDFECYWSSWSNCVGLKCNFGNQNRTRENIYQPCTNNTANNYNSQSTLDGDSNITLIYSNDTFMSKSCDPCTERNDDAAMVANETLQGLHFAQPSSIVPILFDLLVVVLSSLIGISISFLSNRSKLNYRICK